MKNIIEGFKDVNCCGCGACINSCPTKALYYTNNQYGFTIPGIDKNKCIECGKCIKTCPYNNLKTDEEQKVVYAVVNKDIGMLKQSSSGGVFGEIAKTVIEEGYTVYGCTMDSNFVVKHIGIDNLEKLTEIQRSKYVQSFTGDTYSQIRTLLKQNKKVLFSGTPCMIAGLKSYLGKMANSDLLTTIDVVCHGVPSQSLFEDYLKHLSIKLNSKIVKYTFRAKKRARNGMEWNVSYETLCGGLYFRNWPEDSYNYYYMKGAIYRESCYDCPFASCIRYSDITLSDYWHWQEYNLGFKYNDSVSGVILNTSKGKGIFNIIRNNFVIEESCFDDIAKYNSCLIKPIPKSAERDEILDKWITYGYKKIDDDFRRKHKKQIFKYGLMRHLHPQLINIIHKWL